MPPSPFSDRKAFLGCMCAAPCVGDGPLPLGRQEQGDWAQDLQCSPEGGVRWGDMLTVICECGRPAAKPTKSPAADAASSNAGVSEMVANDRAERFGMACRCCTVVSSPSRCRHCGGRPSIASLRVSPGCYTIHLDVVRPLNQFEGYRVAS